MCHNNNSNRGQRDRNRDPRYYRDSRDERHSSSGRSSSQAFNPREADHPRKHVRQGARSEHRESKCTYICSRRGIMLICAVLTNSLVLICVVAAQMVTSGMSSRGGITSFDINSDFNLQGTDLTQMRELDVQYSQMRAPGIYGGVTFSLTMGIISLLFLVSSNKPPHRMPQKLLIGALVFQAVGAVAYVVAIGLYLHLIIRVNSTDVCTLRARLYARNGLTWMNCDVNGADAAVALFGTITAILYTAGAVLVFQTIRQVRTYLQERERQETERRLEQEASCQP
ncbi:MARVEL domain-containing protein 3 [Channa argus]|uniref:MARVEL domain-containing protein 3 n=1 Tax=Channa argus TaxID=215402 RepID=A0A6G1PKE6_CHAAH|nr:MARVEL domain-containing protein 3 [Channa argus]